MACFPKPYCHSKKKIKIELDLSNYATKSDLTGTAGIDVTNFTTKTDLANLKSDADRSNIDMLENTPTNLNNISDLVKREVAKKGVYD